MGCQECHLWRPGDDNAPYEWCKPPNGLVLPWWATKWLTDMQTRTHRTEGQDCDLFSPKIVE
jgi:hypothetical protein